MNLLRLSSLFLAPALLASIALACGEISDPTRGGEKTATISGALTGTSVPAGAHVAIVWRNGQNGGVAVGADAEIVNGKFTMTLTAPPDAYLYSAFGDYDSLNGNNGAPRVSETEPAPPPTQSGTDPGGGGSTSSTSGGAKVINKLGTRDTVSGGITEPLQGATAGFVVYVDANGNGKLDLEGEYASSPDTIIGGNKELILTYLKGGGQLDYEKLRDKSGILPVAGYNLAWDQGRWLPLSLVELKITATTKLPGAVCASSTSSFEDSTGNVGSGGVATTETKPNVDPPPPTPTDAGPAPTDPDPEPYPPAGDPDLHCYDNGHAFYYTGDCPKPPPPPVGLCASGYAEPVACAAASTTFAGDTPPEGWPCPITGPSYNGSSSSSSGGSGGTSSGFGSTSSSSGAPSSDGGPAPDAGGS